MSKSKMIEFQRPEVTAAIKHLNTLRLANESVINGMHDSQLLSEKAIEAYHFFNETLISRLGVSGAAN